MTIDWALHGIAEGHPGERCTIQMAPESAFRMERLIVQPMPLMASGEASSLERLCVAGRPVEISSTAVPCDIAAGGPVRRGQSIDVGVRLGDSGVQAYALGKLRISAKVRCQ